MAVFAPGTFTGELNMLSGRRGLVRVRTDRPSEVIEIGREQLLSLIHTDSELSDIFLRAFILRRLELITRGIGNVILIGSIHSLDSLRHNIGHVFSMTGAVPNSLWLEGCVALDAQGFIRTGSDLSPEELAAARWPLARIPFLLETSLPGVFAVGDVRGGNIKRVASAVGEGSIAVSFVHQVLTE